ncbi:hypothetical protein FRC20_010293 [Serendipita sp. 405]|nr:hypothetical protein FRC20_010293 [Serendipita sp. 405]
MVLFISSISQPHENWGLGQHLWPYFFGDHLLQGIFLTNKKKQNSSSNVSTYFEFNKTRLEYRVDQVGDEIFWALVMSAPCPKREVVMSATCIRALQQHNQAPDTFGAPSTT